MKNNLILESSFKVQEILAGLESPGAVSVRAVSGDTLAAMAREARCYPYVRQPEYLPSGVREQLSSYHDLEPSGTCRQVAKDVEYFLNSWFRAHAPGALSETLAFTETVIQKYENGSIGITPHKDFKRTINLICVLVISGSGRFCICDDRQASNPKPLDTGPGQLIVMRAPGYMGSDIRPFHFIDSITSERYSLGLRQDKIIS